MIRMTGALVLVGFLATIIHSANVAGSTPSACDNCSHGCNKETKLCYCLYGYRLSDDNQTCIVDGDDPVLLYKANDQLRRYYLEYGITDVVLHQAATLSRLAFGPQQTVYWIDSESQIVYQTHIHEGSKEEHTAVIDAGLKSPSGLSVDWSTSILYVVDSDLGNIVACTPRKGDNCAVIQSHLPSPQDIVVNPDGRTLIWSQWGPDGNNGSIMVAWLDGSEARALAVNLHRPTSLTLDRTTNTIFWLASGGDGLMVQKMQLDSEVVTNVKNLSGVPEQSTISVLTDTLYIDNGTVVLAVGKATGITTQIQVDGRGPVTAAKVFHPVLYETNTSDVCEQSDCSRICLPSHGRVKYTCACPYDMYLYSGGRCAEANVDRLLVLGYHGIYKVAVKYIGANAYRGKPLLPDKLEGDSMVYDRVHHSVIYYDKVEKAIKIQDAKHPESSKVLYCDVKEVAGLAIDVVSNNIYWTNKKATVYAGKLDRSMLQQIVQFPDGSAHQLRGIALDSVRGYMYICDWGFQPQIHRCDMDGLNCSTFMVPDGHPNMIVVELDVRGIASMLYWTDSSRNQIRYTALNGSLIQGFIHLQMDMTPHPFDLAVTDAKIFFTDLNSKQLHYVDKNDKRSVHDINLQLGPLMGLDDTTQHSKGGTNACSGDNGGCSHMCLPKPDNRRTCRSPDSKGLTKGVRTCSVGTAHAAGDSKKNVEDVASQSNRDLIILEVFLGLAACTVLAFTAIIYIYRRKRTDEKNALVSSRTPSRQNSSSDLDQSYDLESQRLVPNCGASPVVTYTAKDTAASNVPITCSPSPNRTASPGSQKGSPPQNGAPVWDKISPVEITLYTGHMSPPPPGPIKSPSSTPKNTGPESSPEQPTQPKNPPMPPAGGGNFTVHVDMGKESSSSSSSEGSGSNDDGARAKRRSKKRDSKKDSSDDELADGKDILVVPLIGSNSKNRKN